LLMLLLLLLLQLPGLQGLLTSDGVTEPKVLGLRLAKVDGKNFYTEEGILSLETGATASIQVLGVGISDSSDIRLSTALLDAGQDCSETNTSHPLLHSAVARLKAGSIFEVEPRSIVYSSLADTYYVCLFVNGTFVHQGRDAAVSIQMRAAPLWPTWVNFIFLAFLLCLSGLFSGLNLGLMSLDQTELQIVIKTGSEDEQENAKAISPVRNFGNFLLCSLLFGNVLVNVVIPMLLDSIPGANGIWAVVGSTFGIVVFGEIIPQAICSRHGLAVGAKTIIITKFFMLLTSPLSWPISKLLDLMLGEELGTVYNRARLIELLRVTQAETDLNKDEVNILTGALVLQEKKIEDIMTPLGDCYMLALQAVLDFDTISEIKDKGYSRIPVYDDDESNVVHILLAKDLLFIDPDDKKPLAEVCGFYKTPFIMAEKDRPLNKMLDEFKTGEKGHLAIVKGDEEDQGAIGLVTLEDIIEEIIQAEIIDETDIVMDNKTKRKRKKKGRFVKEKEVRMFMEPNSTQIDVSSQVHLAVLQFLTTSLPPFAPEIINGEILKKLLKLDVFRSTKNHPNSLEPIVKKGFPCDFFVLIIEGKVDVQIGNEGYVFESGPFTSFGKQVLVLPEDETSPRPAIWTPEVTLIPRGEVLYLKVRFATYRAAVLASRGGSGEGSAAEVEKHLQSMIEAQHSPTHETTPLLGEANRKPTGGERGSGIPYARS